jgi:GNAT superfamily N-acetyltransferase
MQPANSVIELGTVTRADLPLLVDLIGELAEYESRRHEVLLDVAELDEALFGPRPMCAALIARVDRQPAGFALWYFSFSTFRGRPNLYIEDLYIRPAFRRLGLGRATMKRLALVASEHRCERLEWSVLNWNQPAIAFYHSLGGKPVEDWKVFQLGSAALVRLAEAT